MGKFTRIAAGLTALTLIGPATIASAEVGKKISVATGNSVGAGAFPTLVTSNSVAVPTTYKSKSNFLKITASHQTVCSGGDAMASEVLVGGVPAISSGLPYEAYDEDAGYQIVTKTYYLAPESQGGPAIPADSLVEVKITSNSGNCGVDYSILTVETGK